MIVAEIGQRFRSSSAFRAVRRELRAGAGGVRATNLAGSSKAVLAAALAEDLGVPLLVLAPTAERGEAWLADLESILGEGEVGWYPQWEILPYEARAPQKEIEGQRLEFLAGLLEGSVRVGVTTARAALQKILPPSTLEDRLLRVAAGDRADLDDLARRLVRMGFEREAMVAEVGTFSIRGGIVDVFGYRYADPVRLELVGDRVESIRSFDLGTQRSLAPLERVEILPARERPGDIGAREEWEGAEQGRHAAGPAAELTALAEWLHPDTLVVRDEPARIAATTGEAWDEVVRRHAEASEERIVPAPEELWLPPDAFERALDPYRRLDLEALHMHGDESAIRFATREPEPVQRSMRRLAEVLRHDLASGVVPVVLCDNLGQLERLEELLPKDVLGQAGLAVGALEGGFRMADAALAVYTDHEIFDRRRRVRRRRRYAAGVSVEHLTRIEPGDYLVHMDYGIGQYEGLERLKLSGEGDVEALKLRYADDEVLYVPVEQLARVEKFTSEDGRPPTIHRLGTGHWERQKAKTEAAIQKLADELLELHAKRESAPGFSFSPDTQWQREMESAFLYEDTPDQRAAAEAVKRDMERPRPMDRLVCGDVGYGKTEIAIRAAFKAVQDGKQVAVLVPTTVLAIQHLETFRERLADFPVEIGALSRFNTATESRAIVEGVADGRIDIVIGTHRLLSKDVQFADLGLVVIDEEQRFGVRHKERLRQLRASVDVLTLTATPIPRTLQMSLMGLREMSLIETPPRDRTPIVTWVSEFDEELIADAIRREVDRGGQVFYVHNRVQTIDGAHRLVESLAPEVRVAVAHGQMPERELERVMVALFHREVDVLVTSAIIESGLDVPSANTIVVARADRFGLADLYQLRGRVGRSHHRAYCYLLTPPRDSMTPEAEKRLRVLEEHTDLGAGYRIALHDLEMRGAGNLLGADQSGFIAAVGFETYLRLLEETIQKLKGEEERPVAEPELAFDADAFLPDGYVPDSQQKLALYRRLSRLRETAAIEDFRKELEDRYGPLPEPAAHLVDAVRFKALAARAGLARIRIRPREARAELRWPPGIEPRLNAIQRSAEVRGVGLEIQGLDPFRLILKAADYAALREALESVVVAFEAAAA
ncbi:MAG TPA: transcription-repair coupling factor [Gemmatimonadota bacterium]|nr:transcription-repair coupling factor [Gemmatimonadota bacterium]